MTFFQKKMVLKVMLHNKNLNLSLLILLIFFSTGCAAHNKIKAADFDKLCSIYKEVSPMNVDLYAKRAKLAEKVKQEIPAFYSPDFVHIQLASASRRYSLIKQIAEETIGKKWDCETIKIFYETQFH